MDFEFHYYMTYLIAARAGFDPHDARLLAYSSQFIDDNDMVLEIDKGKSSAYGNYMHVQQETARCLLDDCGADYLVTAVKQNQPSLLEDLKVMDWREARSYETPWEKAHGRIEQRRCAVIDVTDPLWDGTCMLYGRRQALRIERQRHLLKSGKTSAETVYCLTSLGPEKAGPKELLALVRDHWQVENRLHYVRDVTYDEDRCRARVGNLPRNLAALTNAAISIVRCGHTFDYMPNANRYFAARTQHALDTILNPHLR